MEEGVCEMAWAGGSAAGGVAAAIEEEKEKKRKKEKRSRWECVLVSHHKDIGKTVEEWEKNGWRLHSHEAVGTPTMVNHYLLFERDA